MKKLTSSFKNMLVVLTGITVIATALLAYVNQLTMPAIEQMNAQSLNDAIKMVVPGFDNDPVSESDTIFSEKDGKKDIEYIIYKARKEGEFIGAAVRSSSNGFAGNISILVGFDREGSIIDYSILSHAETPGLGSKMDEWFKTLPGEETEIEKPSLISRFFFGETPTAGGNQSIIGLNPGLNPLKVSKDGGEIDAITASTITSRAFLSAVNNAYNAYMGSESDVLSGATGETDASSEATEIQEDSLPENENIESTN